MDDIKMIGLKDASDATSSLPANCGMYYSIHYDLSDGQVLVREHAAVSYTHLTLPTT